MELEKPPLDPHPLSEYVAWAGNRNREPILKVLNQKFPKEPGNVLEFASGSGMHINFFAPLFKHLQFHPSDKDIDVFGNIKKLKSNHKNDNILDPIHLDLTQPETWKIPGKENAFSAIFCINIFQVAPIEIAHGMMNCASKLLTDEGFLLIYGPFKIEGTFTTKSNQDFDNTLNSAGISEWGLKDTAELKNAAASHNLKLKEQIDMPANNFSLIFGRE